LKKYAIIVAAGLGTRMQHATPKQFLLLKGKPVLLYTLNLFLEAYTDMEIILVLPPQFLEKGEEIISLSVSPHRIKIVPGGETRFQSVKNALPFISQGSVVFVHDGVRCLVSKELIHRCYTSALEMGNAVPAIRPADSIRGEGPSGNWPIDRDTIRIIQTPQTFMADDLKRGFEQGFSASFTDEAIVMELMGIKINLVEGESTNIKITKPIDLVIAEEFLKSRQRYE
jgi:2-C-methyl-D-erythritol 4-phosphate cytidylyltransferase